MKPETNTIKFTPSLERSCTGKCNLGRNYAKQADRMAKKHGKVYGVYRCIYCKGTHLTTKIENSGKYFDPLLYITE